MFSDCDKGCGVGGDVVETNRKDTTQLRWGRAVRKQVCAVALSYIRLTREARTSITSIRAQGVPLSDTF